MNTPSPIIRCHQLEVGYGKNILAKNLDLTVYENQWIGIVGKNGIGKSTFFKTLLGIIPSLSGTLSVLGAPAGKNNKIISYIPQERELNLTEFTSGITLIKACYKGSNFGIPYFTRSFEKNLDFILEITGAKRYASKAFHALSGGQKKRIYLAQALINNPKLMLLDEPLSDLDPLAKHEFIKALKRIHQSKELSLLMISHDMHEIAHDFDHFLHFKNQSAHLCHKLPCLTEDASVTL